MTPRPPPWPPPDHLRHIAGRDTARASWLALVRAEIAKAPPAALTDPAADLPRGSDPKSDPDPAYYPREC